MARLLLSLFITLYAAAFVYSQCSPPEGTNYPPCGEPLGYWNGFVAYSNSPEYQCTGTSCGDVPSYQCVELVQRVFRFHTGREIYGNAIDLCDNTLYVTENPQVGDIVVLDVFNQWGHTGILTGFDVGQTVSVFEQNAWNPTGFGVYNWNDVACYLTHRGFESTPSPPTRPPLPPAPSPPPSNQPSCAGFSDGSYCGNQIPNGVDASVLYTCQNGVVYGSRYCVSGCTVSPGHDYCTFGFNYVYDPENYEDSPAKCFAKPNGYYCGSQVEGDEDTLYGCENNAAQVIASCRDGCIVNDAGPDYCNDPGLGAPLVAAGPVGEQNTLNYLSFASGDPATGFFETVSEDRTSGGYSYSERTVSTESSSTGNQIIPIVFALAFLACLLI